MSESRFLHVFLAAGVWTLQATLLLLGAQAGIKNVIQLG